MEEAFFKQAKENEEKIRIYGPHVAGFVNLVCNAGLYPLFLMSTQLSLSQKPAPDYSGKKFKDKMFSYVFSQHQGNSPYRPAKFYNYTSSFIHNSLQGFSSFFKGFSASVLGFYLSILSKSAASYALSDKLSNLNRTSQILSEIVLSSSIELSVYPLFVIQTRLINQHSKMRVFKNSLEIIEKCGFRSLYAGWGSILPRQVVLSLWAGYGHEIDRNFELVLGSSTMFQVFLREIVVAAGGIFIGYPLITLSRRVAACGKVVGMSSNGYKGITQAFVKVLGSEGISSLYRGFGFFALAV